MNRSFAVSDQAREIFEQVVEINASERDPLLRELCRDNSQLRSDVQTLLSAHDLSDPFLEDPFGESSLTKLPLALEAGERLGNFIIEGLIGDGGFGQVYAARQRSPVVRQVAIKVIKPGMDTAEVLARFEQERQALAVLDHPNIARIIDAGATESGRPFFVMELVAGTPLLQYFAGNRLSIHQCVSLIAMACKAADHAHQQGIVHRDLKPTNILVSECEGVAQPKLIDFGVAKATGMARAGGLKTTQGARMIGTPLYMSPEQAAQSGNIDMRSDVFSLGVVLYHLVCGITPVESMSAGKKTSEEIRRLVLMLRPGRPGAVIKRLREEGTVDQLCLRNWTLLSRGERNDLEWILLKALEVERSRRYQSAIEFAKDLNQWLKRDPVSARPPTLRYRLGKRLRRHRIGLALTAILSMILLVAGIYGWNRAMIANRALRGANSSTEYLLRYLEQSDPRQGGQNMRSEAQLDLGFARLDHFPEMDVATRAKVLAAIGEQYDQLGIPRKAATAFGMATELLESVDQARSALFVTAALGFADARYETGNESEAGALIDALVARQDLDEDQMLRARIAWHLLQGKIANSSGNFADAFRNFEIANRKANESRIDCQLLALAGMADARIGQEDGVAAIEFAREGYELAKHEFGQRHFFTIGAADSLARILMQARKDQEAIDLVNEVLPVKLAMLTPDHFSIVEAYNTLGRAWRRLGNPEHLKQSRDVLELGRKIIEQKSGYKDVKTTRVVYSELADTRRAQGDVAGAFEMQQKVIPISEAVFGENHYRTWEDRMRLTLNLQDLGRYDEAVTQAEECWRYFQGSNGPQHIMTVKASLAYGNLLRKTGDAIKAIDVFEKTLIVHDGPLKPWLKVSLANALFEVHQVERAEELIRNACDEMRSAYGEAQPTAEFLGICASALEKYHRYPAAEMCAFHALRILSASGGNELLRHRLQVIQGLASFRQEIDEGTRVNSVSIGKLHQTSSGPAKLLNDSYAWFASHAEVKWPAGSATTELVKICQIQIEWSDHQEDDTEVEKWTSEMAKWNSAQESAEDPIVKTR